MIDEVALQKCKTQIGFKSDADIANFRKFGQVTFSKCSMKVDPTKIWDILLLDPNERNKVFSDSPALCRAFENTFSRMMADMQNKAPEINFDRTECGNGTISTVVKVRDHVYPQTYDLNNGTISMKASFVTDVDHSDLKDFEKFTMTLKKDQEWTGVSTNNPTWGAIPGIRENFESVAKAADPAAFKDFNCESLSALKDFERKMVNHPSSSPKLMCAAHEQAVAAKTALPYLLNFCDKKSKQNSEVFHQTGKNLKGTD